MNRSITFGGVMPAITTPFNADGSVDHPFLEEHATWMVDAGATALVPLGSLGEGATLDHDERLAVVETLLASVGDRVPIVPGIAHLSTGAAVQLARDVATRGCRGLMVLPPYVYRGTWGETRAHLGAVIEATDLPCMLYNNPIAYGTDVVPDQVAELCAVHPNLVAMKDSGGDVRRITANRALLGNRLALLAGLDDMVVEAVDAGAVGWVAGLVNALPLESMELFRLATSGDREGARALYRWFLPLLRLDTLPEFVQLIKLVQAEVGMGTERVRAPRLVLEGVARRSALDLIRTSLATNPCKGT
jgi:dihydrodipicolinate synthase/N-acetylneuraminate lyase